MATDLFLLVDPPAAGPPRGATLLRSANPVEDGDAHWMRGLTWRPQLCGSSAIGKPILVCATFSGFAAGSSPAPAQYVPPSVAVGIPCSAISGETELLETKDRAAALLDRCQTLGIARELWRGDVAQAETPDLPNDYLANTATLVTPNGTTSTNAIDALGWLEEAAAAGACAGGAMIHCSPYTATVWQSCHLLYRQADGRLLTALGTVVVADPGYDGSATGGGVDATKATAWAYATGMVDVRLGPVQILPPDGDLGSGVDRTDNDFNVYAYRKTAATFDPCLHVGIKVNHATRT